MLIHPRDSGGDGPTGAGKTTTMYASLQHLNDGSRKINTLEDPVEYSLDGVGQSQVNTKFGFDFPELLRNVLRKAPDVIMIGEIRDPETMTTAVRLRTVGTGPRNVTRTDGGRFYSDDAGPRSKSLFPFRLPVGVVSQRLVRTLCPECRTACDLSSSPLTFQDVAGLLEPGDGRTIYGPGGCPACHHLGYVGRTGLFEVLQVNKDLRRMVAQSATTRNIETAAVRGGMTDLRRGALVKVAQGITSMEDILHNVSIALGYEGVVFGSGRQAIPL